MVETESLETRLGNLRNRLAANRDYNDLEALRDQDRQIRQATVSLLTQTIDTVESVLSRAANERNFQQVTSIETAAQKLRYARDRINAMDYGYAGLFAATPIGADQLKQLQQFDAALSGQLASVIAASLALQTDTSTEAVVATSELIIKDVDQFLNGLRDRSQVIATMPAQSLQQGARTILEGINPESDSLSSPDELAPGSTLTIGETNYVVDATIETVKAKPPVSLHRLQQDPETWLISATVAGDRNLLLLSSSTAGRTDSGKPVLLSYDGPATVKTRTGAPRELPLKLSIWSPDSETDAFHVTLDWEDYQQRLTGNQVSPSTVQIFGMPKESQS